MTNRPPPPAEARPTRESWLIGALVIALMLSSLFQVAYRFTLPTDGWEVSSGNPLGLTYLRNILGNPSELRPGDLVIAAEGIPAVWETLSQSDDLRAALRAAWRAGATLRYTVVRDGAELQLPVTLAHWELRPWLLFVLREPDVLVRLLSTFALLALAAFIFLRRPGNPAAGAFLIIMSFFAFSSISDSLPAGLGTWPDPLASFLDVGVAWTLLTSVLPFGLIRFALVFPRPKPIHQRHPWLPYAAGAVGLLLTLVAPASPLNWFWFVLSMLLTMAILIHNALTMRDVVSRAQMRWGLGGMVIGLGTLTLMFVGGTLGLFPPSTAVFNVAAVFATTVMGVMLAVAITRYRLFDIDILIQRALIYSVLTALLALVYFGSVIVIEGLLRGVVGGESPIAIVLSTLVIAALFGPVRVRVQRAIDRRFYRRKYDAAQTLAAFGAAARDEVDLDQLAARLVNVVDDTMQPAHVSLWLKTKT